MDIVPFARVVELEGPEEEILRLEARWDLTMSRLVLKVIIIFIRSGGSGIICRPTLSFVFTPEELARWRRDLGLPTVEDSPHGR